MVKIKQSPSRKRYLNGKRVYGYFRFHLPIPSRFAKKITPFLKEDFQADITEDNSKIALTYTCYKKNNASLKQGAEAEKNEA
jgi:hypothetical protein